MPIYEYRCHCGNEFESLKSIKDFDKPQKCERCGKDAFRTISTGISGGSTPEPWEYEYTHYAQPKFVKDSKGKRHKFDPTKHTKGRRGMG